jgi:drug/metabolite transporter (DMT)-like permease
MTQKQIKQRRILSKIALIITTMIWGGSFVVVKNTVDVIPPIYLMALRFTIAAALLVLVFVKRMSKADKSDAENGLVIGIYLACAYISQTLGITMTTPGKNAFLTAVYCVIVPFLWWFVSKKRPDAWQISAAFLCIIGIGLVSLKNDFTIGTGDLLTLLCGVFYAVHMTAITRRSKGRDPVVITVFQFISCAAICWAYSLIFEHHDYHVPGSAWISILFLAVFATAFGIMCQNIAQKYDSPMSVSVICSLESVFGVTASVIFYNERPSFRMYMGFILIFAAVLISELLGGRKQKQNT